MNRHVDNPDATPDELAAELHSVSVHQEHVSARIDELRASAGEQRSAALAASNDDEADHAQACAVDADAQAEQWEHELSMLEDWHAALTDRI